MDRPPARSFRGRAKWGEVVGNLVLAALGGALAWAAFTIAPPEAVAMRALGWYTVAAALATLALAAGFAVTKQLPEVGAARLEGVVALVARAWRGEWWYATAIDSSLALLAGVLAVLGVAAGGSWVLPALLVVLPGLWFLVRVVLTLTGRRRSEALWLTPVEVVHDATWGRQRTRREHITRVRGVGGTPYLLLDLAGPMHWELCPRGWRQGRIGAGATQIMVDCAMMGHDTDDLAAWLRRELGVGETGSSPRQVGAGQG